jgi:orotate phosphoribosyltransferase
VSRLSLLSSQSESGRLSAIRAQLVEILKRFGHREMAEPVELASGDLSRHFIDAKRALSKGEHLRVAAEALLEAASGRQFDAVGGLTMGADQFAHAVVMLRPNLEWFSVRKEAKARGTRQRIEGAELGPGRRVLLVDDVLTRGDSMVDAYEAIEQTGAVVVCALALVDRGGGGGKFLEDEGISYHPLVTHEDLGIPAVGSEPGIAAAAG